MNQATFDQEALPRLPAKSPVALYVGIAVVVILVIGALLLM